jgi:hypothetical protein
MLYVRGLDTRLDIGRAGLPGSHAT